VQRRFQLRLASDNKLEFFGFVSGAGSTVGGKSTTTIAADTWYNVLATFNTTQARLWVNEMADADVEVTATNSAGTTNLSGSDPFRIGQGAGTQMDGLIACAGCLSRVVTEAERLNIATKMSAL
jgi:hypothetical protein